MNQLSLKTVKTALISVFDKEPASELIHYLHKAGVVLYASGGTHAFIEKQGIPVIEVETLTGYPSLLGGRIKTLHPMVFGGILARSANASDSLDLKKFGIPVFDMVVVDLYPFEQTLSKGGSPEEVTEQIDIGGVSLIRAAAKNFRDVLVVPSRDHYARVLELLKEKGGMSNQSDRQSLAAEAMKITAGYDRLISSWLGGESAIGPDDKQSGLTLRYGENPHQTARFQGSSDPLFEQLSGKELSYNNILDADAAIRLLAEMPPAAMVIIKHTNVCGAAVRPELFQAWQAALAGDPVSAFGGILAANKEIDENTAREIDKLFFELLMAPGFSEAALNLLSKKAGRRLLRIRHLKLPGHIVRSALDGLLWQQADEAVSAPDTWQQAGSIACDPALQGDMQLAEVLVKHLKSNAIALVRNGQLLGAGMGQTSRIDALKQAIAKARESGHDLNGAVMASDAFFPFPDCVELAAEAGIKTIIQPGGSKRDSDSVQACDRLGLAMVFTGMRHFRH